MGHMNALKRPPLWHSAAACIPPSTGSPCSSCPVRARCTAAHSRQVSGPLAAKFLAEVA